MKKNILKLSLNKEVVSFLTVHAKQIKGGVTIVNESLVPFSLITTCPTGCEVSNPNGQTSCPCETLTKVTFTRTKH